MSGIDWSATGSMIGGIGSVIAVAVAIALSELQHRRTIRLIQAQDAKQEQQRSDETIALAMWTASVLFDLSNKAKASHRIYKSIVINGDAEIFPPEQADQVGRLLDGLMLKAEQHTIRIIDHIPRFDTDAVTYIIPAIRRARYFDVRNQDIVSLLHTGQVKVASLQAALQLQCDVLLYVQRACDKAFELLTQAYSLQSLQDQLETKAPDEGDVALDTNIEPPATEGATAH